MKLGWWNETLNALEIAIRDVVCLWGCGGQLERASPSRVCGKRMKCLIILFEMNTCKSGFSTW